MEEGAVGRVGMVFCLLYDVYLIQCLKYVCIVVSQLMIVLILHIL